MTEYNWKKTAEKFWKEALIVIVAGLAATYGDNPTYLALAPMIHAGINYLKHK